MRKNNENNKINDENANIDQLKNKVDLGYDLKLERDDSKELKEKEYDFVARFNHLLSFDEQKIKVEEIENKTK